MKSVKGICKLCGMEKQLSFEHVPPRSVFNKHSVEIYDALQRNGVDSVHITYEGAGHFLSSKGAGSAKEKFAADDARRSEAFYAFAQKYGS